MALSERPEVRDAYRQDYQRQTADTLARNERDFSSSNDPIAQSKRERLQRQKEFDRRVGFAHNSTRSGGGGSRSGMPSPLRSPPPRPNLLANSQYRG
jgi:hypothetical protein